MADEHIKHILIVEDNQDHQRLVIDSIKQWDTRAHVTTAANGREMLQLVGSRRFDAVVLDYMLTDYQADELIELTREKLPEIPIIVISSRRDQETVASVMRHGGDDFLPKFQAITTDMLGRRITEAITRKRTDRRRRRRKQIQQRQLIRLVESDPLTGLHNRRYLEQVWRNRPDLSGMEPSQIVGYAIMFDLDRFKSINDRFGHVTGDEALQRLAQCLLQHREQDTELIRYGGEEFFALRSATDEMELWQWAERIRQAVEAMTVHVSNARLHLTISIGLAPVKAGDDLASAIHRADRALYLAKNDGRNRIATERMVRVDTESRRVARLPGLSLRKRRELLLSHLQPQLGNETWKHVDQHCRRVAALVDQIACNMKLGEQDRRRIVDAALFHDIGKCALPEKLVAKPHPLNPAESRLMQSHAARSAAIAKAQGADRRTVHCIAVHHTRYDDEKRHSRSPCKGRMLNGEVCGAGLLSVADAMDTMVSGRSYRSSRSVWDALDELQRESGGQFDPRAVQAMLQQTPVQLRVAA